MATHSSILAWKISWMEEPGRLQPMGSQGVGHDWATSLSYSGYEKTKIQKVRSYVQGSRSHVWCTWAMMLQSKQVSALNTVVLLGIWWDQTAAPHDVHKDTIPVKCLSKPKLGFPDSSVGKESTCDAGDPSLIPRLGRSTGEVIGYPLKYSWASLVAQLVKNPPAMQETWVPSLGWEDPLEKGKVTQSSILAWKIPCGHKDSDTTEQLALPLSSPNWTPFGIPLEIHKRNRGEERSWSLDLDEWLQAEKPESHLSLSFFFAFSRCCLSFIPILSTCLSF